MKRKKIYALFLVLTMVLMVGCGAQDDTQPTQNESEPTISAMTSYETYTTILESVAFMESSLQEFTALINDIDGNTDMTHTEIKVYETTWASIAIESRKWVTSLNDLIPSAEYAQAWENMVSFAESLDDIAHKLSNWDTNNDGEYTSSECSSVVQYCLDSCAEASETYFQPFSEQFLAIPEPEAPAYIPNVDSAQNTAGFGVIDNHYEFSKGSLPEYDTYEYSFTIQNNTGLDIEALYLICVITDLDGNLLGSSTSGFHNTIRNGKSVILEEVVFLTDYDVPFCIVPDEFHYELEGEEMSYEVSVDPEDAELFTITITSANPESDDSHGSTDTGNKNNQGNNGTSTPFTNKFGTPTTKCAHTGCYNYIANSGDTNCCEEHSNRCIDCNKYIDEDAYWCVSCIAAAATPTCEACGKDATHTITGITGQTEYYCTEHYNEMKELLEWMENN